MKNRSAHVYVGGVLAGRLAEGKDSYTFLYERGYLEKPNPIPVAISLPCSAVPYHSKTLFPFFKGLLPEGWLLELNARSLKIDPKDEFGMLLRTGMDCIGAVTVVSDEENQ